MSAAPSRDASVRDGPIVGDVMTRDPATIGPEDKVCAAIARLRECSCRRLPVVEDCGLVGIVSDRDLRLATNSPFVLRERWYDDLMLDHISVRACMTVKPVTVTPETDPVAAVQIMRDKKVGGLPAVKGNRLVGITTDTDLSNYLIRILSAWERDGLAMAVHREPRRETGLVLAA